MPSSFRLLFLSPLVLVAGCATNQSAVQTNIMPASIYGTPPAAEPLAPPAQAVATAGTTTTDVSAYVDPTAYAQLSEKSRAQAAGAQINALQFGRVGAPRDWQGDAGVSGEVTVGPYVRVNLIDCRDFTNTVTIKGTPFVRKGTACREADGSWSVASTKAG